MQEQVIKKSERNGCEIKDGGVSAIYIDGDNGGLYNRTNRSGENCHEWRNESICFCGLHKCSWLHHSSPLFLLLSPGEVLSFFPSFPLFLSFFLAIMLIFLKLVIHFIYIYILFLLQNRAASLHLTSYASVLLHGFNRVRIHSLVLSVIFVSFVINCSSNDG